MEGSIGSRVCRGVRSCWMGRRSYYQRLPASRRPARRRVRLSRLAAVLASTPARGFGRLRRAKTRWPSTLRLLRRIVDAYVGSLLSRPLRILRAGVPPGAEEKESVATTPPTSSSSSPPTKPRLEASPAGSRRRSVAGGGRGVMLNICVAEALLLRRSTSEVRRSPLQRPREAGRRSGVGVRAQSSFQ
ncbi:hypothetical protein PVAP13_5NG293200 [Panicum virgatum]|uniref:Uncharacterized protein n=1 Tax=Panicum virgatum TaxID=38727 RepID=A0A8T0RZB0_PANVG|nr:hypothetical protein PVAP13_5NG293200 [Panicum virgatum]